jgi:DNA invertase Pin-like site-specific DNA recombinase
MANALVIRKDTSLAKRNNALRAAQYVRMSTDKQRYSIANQAAAIAVYAHAHNLQIVKTYRDEGESGLHIKNRAGLQELIADVVSGDVNYGNILVYDVSRWGRFQDTDESAHYEFVCKKAGVKVTYCAEQFEGDGTMLSSILKNLKRVMAAEYSRELSNKVHAGQSRIASLGFRPGAPITYALRRELVDESLRPKFILQKGERKSLQTDRVRVKIGADDEVAVVRWIFKQCLDSKTDEDIARELNRKAVPTASGGPWNRAAVSRILRNEVYIGNIVYNRFSRKLGGPKVRNHSDLVVRGKSGIDAIVDPEIFRRVSRRIEDRRVEVPEGEMLLRLRKTLHKKGRLSPAIIEDTSGLPGVDTFIRHFGGLRNTYRLIGYTSKRDHSFIDAVKTWARVTATLVSDVAAHLERSGRHISIGETNDELMVDDRLRIIFRVARSYPIQGQLTTWRVPRIVRPASDFIVATRLTDDNQDVLDYVLIPTAKACGKHKNGYMRFTEMARERHRFRLVRSAKALAGALSATCW